MHYSAILLSVIYIYIYIYIYVCVFLFLFTTSLPFFCLCYVLLWCFSFCDDHQSWCEQMWKLLVIVRIAETVVFSVDMFVNALLSPFWNCLFCNSLLCEQSFWTTISCLSSAYDIVLCLWYYCFSIFWITVEGWFSIIYINRVF